MFTHEQQEVGMMNAWLMLMKGRLEDARAQTLEVTSEQEWQRSLKRYQTWIERGCPAVTLEYLGFDADAIERITSWLERNQPWYPESETELETKLEAQAEAPQLPAANDLYMDGKALLHAMMASRLSIVLVGSPGTGKTTTVKAVALGVLRHRPNTLLRMVGMKNYDWFGLASIPGFSTVLLQSEHGGLDFGGLIESVNWLADILEKRRTAPEGVDYSGDPAWLVITDYTPIANELIATNPKLASQIFSLINRLITVGREFNVGILLDLHSLNLAALGFSDSYERGGMMIVGLGYEYHKDGRLQGNYNALQGIFRNTWITLKAPAFRAELGKAIATSKLTEQRLFWTSANGEKLGFMPDLSALEGFSLPEQTLQGYAVRLKASLLSVALPNSEGAESVQDAVSCWAEEQGSEAGQSIQWSLIEWAQNTEAALARAVRLLEKEKGKKFVKEQILGCRGGAYTTIGKPWLQQLLSKGE